MLCVRDVMHTHVYRVEQGQTVSDVARTLIFHDVESALVFAGDDLVGIITERDLLRAVLPTTTELNEADGVRAFADLVSVARDHFSATVDSVMSSPVRTIELDASLLKALGTMLAGRIRRLPVTDGTDVIVGVVTQRDLLRAVFMEWQHGIGALYRALSYKAHRE